jgi:hypothetical protein
MTVGTRDIPHDDLRRATVEGIMAYTEGNPDRWWLHRRILADGRVLYLQPMLGGNLRVSLSQDVDDCGFHTNYCFHDHGAAWRAALGWDGDGDPEGWVRHIETGRRRPEGDAAREYVNP